MEVVGEEVRATAQTEERVAILGADKTEGLPMTQKPGDLPGLAEVVVISVVNMWITWSVTIMMIGTGFALKVVMSGNAAAAAAAAPVAAVAAAGY